MTENEIQALSNCNSRTANILKGTLTSVDELVKVGTQVECDMAEERAFWRQRQLEQVPRVNETNRPKHGRAQGHSVTFNAKISENQVNIFTLTILINN